MMNTKSRHHNIRIQHEMDRAIYDLAKRSRRSWSDATKWLLALALKKINGGK